VSAKLAMRVLESGLSSHLKLTATVLALFADDDGNRIYPSVTRVGFLVGKSPRRVTADLTKLIERRVLIPVSGRTGGRGQATVYRLDTKGLPWRAPYVPPEPRRARQGLEVHNRDTDVRVSRAETLTSMTQTLTSVTETLTSMTQNPDVRVIRSVSDPLVDLPIEREGQENDGLEETPTEPDTTDRGHAEATAPIEGPLKDAAEKIAWSMRTHPLAEQVEALRMYLQLDRHVYRTADLERALRGCVRPRRVS